ncbi:transcriptional regulator, TetR family [Aliiroseovarius crassostreae]|uniref:HTH tetR-type domain-containing protein n=1 Tax=Aliiroseovarius crassostreae TaxID=154981 RepID=A0A0P7IHH5_9RHOB|nr:TetR/AcrR family transcriptional regulator [Aliiroseovarius crassostreae]KPN63397.1 hypothetical protein AKJ29_12075 [Aliiroseovarius crassostreae]SFU42979.1 transcriptional regulator, TetR family [Aliiroseovarius crassostreae]
MQATETDKAPHRRGDVREALIAAGLALISEQGSSGLTLRKCAARAGVSHAAPAHHFAGLAGLKHAVVLEGFRQFTAELHKDLQDVDEDPLRRLKTICRTYVSFCLARPALFKEMFALYVPDVMEGKMDRVVRDAWDIFRTQCQPFVREDLPLEIVELRVRSFLHGYTRVALTGQFGKAGESGYPIGPLEEVMAMLDHLAHPNEPFSPPTQA